jgi:translation initiation factor 2D
MVQISSERRQGNKQVTRIVGMEDFLVPADAVAQACQKRFACATTTAELPGKQKSGHEVILQGNVVEKVAEYLMCTYGVPKKYFLVKK